MQWQQLCTNLARAHGQAVMSGKIRLEDVDFVVEEELGFEPDGEGEHLFLYVEKSGMTTFMAQRCLAQHFKVPVNKVSFAGMKDRRALTRQWFSVQVGLNSALASPTEVPGVICLRAQRNRRKLRRGSHRGNHFRIRVRHANGNLPDIEKRLEHIAHAGIPNYFGPQRFGPEARNLALLAAWFEGTSVKPAREERSMLLSAGRSFLFNRLLSARVQQGSWNGWIAGDCMALSGSGATFPEERATPTELDERLARMDIHATGPLYGVGQSLVSAAAAVLENDAVQEFPALTKGLESAGMTMQRRPLRAQVQQVKWMQENGNLVLEFFLGRGSYATAVLRELLPGEPA